MRQLFEMAAQEASEGGKHNYSLRNLYYSLGEAAQHRTGYTFTGFVKALEKSEANDGPLPGLDRSMKT